MKILTIIGARPQFIKAAVVSRAIGRCAGIEEKILHTGQHYDHNMSRIFFDDLGLPRPAWLLDCCSMQPKPMAEKIAQAVGNETFDCVLLYGDTNSTLAGALFAEQRRIPIAHVEAGLRSFNNAMAEEHNRIETDKRSKWLFCPTHLAVKNLQNENVAGNIYNVGDVMYDAALLFASVAEQKSSVLADLKLTSKQFYLATIHRAENTNNEVLMSVFSAFARIATPDLPIVLPLHPRTRNIIASSTELQAVSSQNPSLRITDPVNYLDMIMLEKHAKLILTDSGGVQKEAYFHKTPCVTIRNETEWVETVEAGWNVIAGTTADSICRAVGADFACQPISDYGTGDSANKIINILCQQKS